MKFESLSLSKTMLKSIEAVGYHEPTPIQEQTIPHVLNGRDVVGCAQTGTGKTAAFALPTLQRLMETANRPTTGAGQRRKRSRRRVIRSLILSPTRELAAQIGESLVTYGTFTGLKYTVIYGGVKQHSQVKALNSGVDILVATPGRLLDLIGQGFVHLENVEILILDEADQMLDMGFIQDLYKIVADVPAERQTLMFSATMLPEIRKLARQWLRRPAEVQATPEASTAEFVSQEVFYVERKEKQSVLTQFLMGQDRKKTLVFSRTKRGADKIARRLLRDGIHAVSIHGDKSQAKRKAVMKQFSSRRPPVLVATDLAARGLDFSGISHVINYDLPNTPEIYVHRIGRTARAGASGKAITFCASDERLQLRQIERLTGEPVPVKKVPILSQELRAMTKKPEPIDPDQVENQEPGEGKKTGGQGGHGGSGKKNSRGNMKARRGSGVGSSRRSKRRKNTKRSGKKIKAVKRTAVTS
jgi:ATP-dependent RNA helicase RhlE